MGQYSSQAFALMTELVWERQSKNKKKLTWSFDG